MHRELDRSSPISSKILGFTHASRTGNSLLARKKGTFETKLRWGEPAERVAVWRILVQEMSA
jgi:hypothetical protein